jgi:ADP-ribose pyrophosphatase YjhB (NUDIX family)
VGVIFIYGIAGFRVLITQRSNKMMDEAGKFGVPCGYMDWEETGYLGMMREVYEETSFYMPDYEKYLIFNNDKQPFFVKDDPTKDKRQNVSLLYVSAYDFEGKADKFPLAELEAFTCKETAKVMLMKVVEFFGTKVNYDWAFSHDETIQLALQYFNKNFNRTEL